MEVAKLIEKVPAEIRAQAFTLLASYVSGTPLRESKREESADTEPPSSPEDREGFFSSFTHEKPADNVKLIAAWWYSQHGSAALSLAALRALATDVGLTIPERPEETLRQAAHEGKTLFKAGGRALWEPTVHGESYLKKTYKVKKGKNPLPSPEK
jgi:hypothetical protein